MIACSPGRQPAPAGSLNDSVNAVDSKYTVNINTEMNYWLTEPAPERVRGPLFDACRHRPDGRSVARHYNARGSCTTL